jgi:hypothetical protein
MRVLGLGAALVGLLGCDPDAKLCRERMQSAQAVVAQVDGKSIASVEQSLSAVTEAHAACEKAKLGTERELLLKAKNELSAQRELLEQREHRKKQQAPSATELAELVKHGDPNCPKGQAYKPKDSKSEVRCTGPELVDMSLDALKTYFGDRHFKLTTQGDPPTLRAEHGAETFVFTFASGDTTAPRCVTAYAASGVSWQEVAARLSGAAPERLKLDQALKSGSGEQLALKVEHATDQPKVTLCHAGASSPPP